MDIKSKCSAFCSKIYKIENIVVDFLIKHHLVIVVILVSLLALIVRYKLLPYQSGDYQLALSPWFETLKAGGGFAALADFPGDYNAPYMTIMAFLTYLPFNSLYTIKAVSIVFDIVLALACAYLVYTLCERQPKRKLLTALTYIVVLFLPQVFLNSAYWGQCDSIFASFCVLAVIFLIKDKFVRAFLFLGLAMAFKLQFIFILPVFIIAYLIKRKFSILLFLLVPLTNFALCLPAIIMGKPIADCLLIYFRQTQTFASSISMNYINLYNILGADPIYWNLVGTILTLVVCIIVAVIVINYKIKFDAEHILAMTIWFSIVIPFLLPGMHERYLYVGEMLSVVYYIIYRKNGFVTLLINAYAWIMYTFYFFGATDFNYSVLALIELFMIGWFTKKVFMFEKGQSPIKLISGES